MPKFCLVVGAAPTDRVEEHETAPAPNPIKGVTWLPYVKDAEPVYDRGLQTIGPWAKAIVNGQVIDSRAVSDIPGGLEDFRARMLIEIDRRAESCRKLYITAGEGQAMSYLVKVEEAKDCVAKYDAGTYTAQQPPTVGTYPILESEVGAGLTGADVKAVADVILARRALWLGIEKQINTLRITAKRDAAAAMSVPAIRAVVEAILWPTIQVA